MLSKLIARITIFALRSKRLTGEQKARVTGELLKNIQAIPYKDIIRYNAQGQIETINGRKLDPETALAFMDSCKALRDNYARKVINDQVMYKATLIGTHEGLSPDSIMFAKAAIWNIKEEDILISTFLD